jgi:biotin transport system substrate-specific component
VSKSTSLVLPQRSLGRLSHVLLQALLVGAGSALIALSARVAVPLPFSPVPMTGQTLAVLLVAGLLGRRSALSVGLYLCGGALGLPVFAADWGGFARLTGPTGGYLWGFILAAYVAGWLAERGRGSWWRLLAALLAGQALIYGCGLLWLRRFVPAGGLLVAGFYPFLVGDGLKLVAALVLVAAGRRIALRLG